LNGLKAVIREQKFDAIVVARLTRQKRRPPMFPARSIIRILHYGSLAAYYGAVYPLVYSPGYLVNERSAQVEANFYSTEKPDGELVWTGIANTFNASR
jgi:hypothetical protein